MNQQKTQRRKLELYAVMMYRQAGVAGVLNPAELFRQVKADRCPLALMSWRLLVTSEQVVGVRADCGGLRKLGGKMEIQGVDFSFKRFYREREERGNGAVCRRM